MDLSNFCNNINSIPLQGTAIFKTSKKENACHPLVYESVIKTISDNVEYTDTLRYNDFLTWCNKHTNYIITNKCTDKELDGFELIDTIQIPNFYDTNLFKIK